MIDLEQAAAAIPTMVGRRIKPSIRDAARNAPPDTAIVEVGSWLGALTAQLAIGVLERKQPVPIHCFDRWQANESEVIKAAERGATITAGQDTSAVVRKFLEPFPAPLYFHKGQIDDATWSGPEISVYIDDAAKQPKLFDHVLKTFGPFWIPGETILFLMDYYFWEKTAKDRHKCQRDFVEAHPGHFTALERFGVSQVFRYEQRIVF